MTDPLLLDPDSAAERLGLSRSSVYELVRSGRLRAVRPLAGALKFRASDLADFVEALEAVAPETAPNHTGQPAAGAPSDRVRPASTRRGASAAAGKGRAA